MTFFTEDSMKKSLLAVAALAGSAMLFNACAISEMKPEPVPLKAADMAHFTVDNSAIADQFTVCGEKVKDFQATLRNGFNYAANHGDNAAVVNASKAQGMLNLRSLEMECIGQDKLNGYIITGKASISWKIDNGAETIYPLVVYGASEKSVEKALNNLVTQVYNAAFTTYLTNHLK